MANENGILAKIREIVRQELGTEFEDMVGKKFDKAIDERLEQLVPVMVERQLNKQGPVMVVAELHRVLEGEPVKALPPGGGVEAPEIPEGTSCRSRKPKDKKRGKLGPRPRCPKCKAAMPKSGCRKCK